MKSLVSAVIISSTDIDGGEGRLIVEPETHTLNIDVPHDLQAEVKRVRLWICVIPNIDTKCPDTAFRAISEELAHSRYPLLSLDYIVVCVGKEDVPLVEKFASLPAEKFVYIYDSGATEAGLNEVLERTGHDKALMKINGLRQECFVLVPRMLAEYYFHLNGLDDPELIVSHMRSQL